MQAPFHTGIILTVFSLVSFVVKLSIKSDKKVLGTCMTSPMILVVRMRSDTDGPNRFPGKSRLTLLRSNTGISSAGVDAAWRVTRAELRLRRVLGGLGFQRVRGACRTHGSQGSRLRQRTCCAFGSAQIIN
ncbi:jg23186 [Pararge aegeria aegeria]|uniref:Jg23186 protein n=1 Tax=Pararge aegeria aegeria TaxID=348720 RepID=A0A8S4QT25_9NEOP|nr:jg23186 [Pararge aegeria aegeria]